MHPLSFQHCQSISSIKYYVSCYILQCFYESLVKYACICRQHIFQLHASNETASSYPTFYIFEQEYFIVHNLVFTMLKSCQLHKNITCKGSCLIGQVWDT